MSEGREKDKAFTLEPLGSEAANGSMTPPWLGMSEG